MSFRTTARNLAAASSAVRKPCGCKMSAAANPVHGGGGKASWIQKNKYYYACLKRLLGRLVEPGKRVLNIHCQTGFLLDAVQPAHASVWRSARRWSRSRRPDTRVSHTMKRSPRLLDDGEIPTTFCCATWDIADVQKALLQLQPACERHTRLLIYGYNYLWEPLLTLAQRLHLKIPQAEQNWLSEHDLWACSPQRIRVLRPTARRCLPKYVPLLSSFDHRVIAKLPLLERLCMIEWWWRGGLRSPSPIPMCPRFRGAVQG